MRFVTPTLPPNEEEMKSNVGTFNRSRFILISLAFVLSPTPTLKTEKSESVRPVSVPDSCMPIVAKERGYFAQEGLDLDVLVARGQICTMALINGQMELTTNPNMFDAMVAGKFQRQGDLCHG